MHFYKRGDVWYVRANIDGRDLRRTTGRTNRKEAEAWARDVLGRMEAAKTATQLARAVQKIRADCAPVSFAEAWETWTRSPKRREPGATALRSKRSVWNDCAAFCAKHGAPSVNDVTEAIAAAYIQQLRTSGRWDRSVAYRLKGKHAARTYENQTRALSPKTLNEYHRACAQIMEVSWKRAGLPENPFDGIATVVNRPARREAFSRGELGALLDAADAFMRPVVVLGACTGLRLGDLATLRWAEVDVLGGWITRRLRKNQVTVRIPLLDRARELLESMDPTGEYVMRAQAAMYAENPSGLHWRMRKLIELVGLDVSQEIPGRDRKAPARGFHSLRHSFVWMAAEAGVAMPVVQSIAGHLTPAMTRLYADHATEASSRRAVAVIGDPFGERGAAAVDLAGVSDAELLAEVRRRNLRP